jgi:deoxycytidine triphosphate deaminase
MSIKSDHWIRRMAEQQKMIEPFAAEQVRHADGHKIVSYGTSSYGYDVRCSREFKIFTNINSTIVDPKAFDEKSFVDVSADVCIIPPNSFALARTVEYFRIPRSTLVVCLGKSTYARCFSGNTRVALVDGTAPTLEEMARRHESGEVFWGYSIGTNGRLIVTLLDAPRFIGRDSLLEIVLDNGASIRATPDHLFMKRDGRMAEANSLRAGDALMPLYREAARGYEMVYQPLTGHLYPTHRLADEWNLRNGIYADLPGTHRHHADFDRANNRPTNIVRMLAEDHIRLHNEENYGEGFDSEVHGLAISEALRLRQGQISARAWARDDGSRRSRQAEIARLINLRGEITAEVVRAALDTTGSIRGAANLLECDRSVFRRVPQVLMDFRGTPAYRNHKIVEIRQLKGEHDVYCLTVPEAGNFGLDAGVFVQNCGIIVNVTPLEPEWEGHVTLEFSNTTPLPAKIYANEGVAQMLFFESDEVCGTSYKDRGGKYQGQRGVTLPKT